MPLPAYSFLCNPPILVEREDIIDTLITATAGHAHFCLLGKALCDWS